jgi:hypothetical protein
LDRPLWQQLSVVVRIPTDINRSRNSFLRVSAKSICRFPTAVTKNIEHHWYEAGHMAYVRDECRKQLHDRVAAFIKSADSAQ